MRPPSARLRLTYATASSVERIGMISLRPVRRAKRNVAGKGPAVTGPVDADVLRARFHPKRVEQPVIVVWKAVSLVDRDVQFVRAFDEIEAVDRKCDGHVAGKTLRIHLLEIGVGAVTTHAVCVEQTDAEHEVVDWMRGAHPDT